MYDLYADYSANGFAKLRDCLGLLAGHDPRSKHQVLTNKYYVPLRDNGGKLIQTIDSLKVDKNVPADEREKRATGCALQIAIGMLS